MPINYGTSLVLKSYKTFMNDIKITTILGLHIKATLHDIVCNLDGSNAVLIADFGSWGGTLSEREVFDDIRSWIIPAAKMNQAVINAANKIFFLESQPNISIAELLIVVFEILTPKSKMVQDALTTWIKGDPEIQVLKQLDLFLQTLLKDKERILTSPVKLKARMETKEHFKYLLNYYSERRNQRMINII